MINPTDPAAATATDSSSGPVLLWHPDRDESHVKGDVDEAARFLDAGADEVRLAIDEGDLLRGWFVDWEAGSTS